MPLPVWNYATPPCAVPPKPTQRDGLMVSSEVIQFIWIMIAAIVTRLVAFELILLMLTLETCHLTIGVLDTSHAIVFRNEAIQFICIMTTAIVTRFGAFGVILLMLTLETCHHAIGVLDTSHAIVFKNEAYCLKLLCTAIYS